jgi:hypothetical protein
MISPVSSSGPARAKAAGDSLKFQTTMCNEAIVSLSFDYRHGDERLL